MKKFSPIIQEVDQFGFVDLRSAYENNAVSGDYAVASSESFNEASPDVLMRRPSDMFEARRQRDYIRATLDAKAASAKAASAKAAVVAAASESV